MLKPEKENGKEDKKEIKDNGKKKEKKKEKEEEKKPEQKKKKEKKKSKEETKLMVLKMDESEFLKEMENFELKGEKVKSLAALKAKKISENRVNSKQGDRS